MKRLLYTLFAIGVLVIPVSVFAQEEDPMVISAPDESVQIEITSETEDTEGISPESPFYFLTTLFEDVQLLLTFDEQEKIEKTLEFAERKLRAMETLNEEQGTKVMEKLEYRFEKLLGKAEKAMEKEQYTEEENAQTTQEIRDRHLAVLNTVLDKAPEGQAQESIQKVITKTEEKYVEKDSKIKSNNKGGNNSNQDDEVEIEEE